MNRAWRRWIAVLVLLSLLAPAWGQTGEGDVPTTPDEAVPTQPAADGGQCDRVRLFGADSAATGTGLLQQIKNPVPGWEWGFNLLLRETYIGNGITLNKRHPDHEWHWQRQRVRLWSAFTPCDDLEFNVGLAWEGKDFDWPLSFANWSPTSPFFDRQNVEWSAVGVSCVDQVVEGRSWLLSAKTR